MEPFPTSAWCIVVWGSTINHCLIYLEQATAIFKEIGDKANESTTLTNIGIVYKNIGQYEEALSYFEQSMLIDKEIGNRRGEGKDMGNICNLYTSMGKYEKAFLYYEKALVIFRETGDRLSEGVIHGNIGAIYDDLGQYEKALHSFNESLKISLEIEAPEYIWMAQRGLGSVETKLKKYDDAIVYYEQALDTIESIREKLLEKEVKTGFMRNKIFVYDEFIELLQTLHKKHPNKGYDRKSLEIFERKQGRIFAEEMGKSGARNFAGLPDKVRQKETELENQLAKLQSDLVNERSKPRKEMNTKRIRSLEERISKIKAEQQALQNKIKTEHPDYYAIKYPKPATLKELQENVLKSGEILLVYGVMEKTTCLWAISKTHFSMHTIDTGTDDLTEKVQKYRQNALRVSAKDLRGKVIPWKTDKKLSEIPDLYALLFPEPIRKTMTQAKLLYIIPTGPLYMLPFEALTLDPKAEKPHYLIQDHALAYLSSASLLKIIRDAQTRKKQKSPYPLLAFANPVYGKSTAPGSTIRGLRTESYRAIIGGNFAPLPETEDEAKAIRDILKAPAKSKPLQLKQNASRSNVMKFNESDTLDDYRYLVFACHGILPGEINHITQPALALSDPDPETGQEGFLTMADVFGLKLNADLITLSACNTGRGREIKGEGVMGLTRAFMYAGTPAITVTLWSVESRSAKQVNVGLFQNLKAGKNRAQALRDIKLRMIRGEEGKAWRHPYYWAPVVVFGDGN